MASLNAAMDADAGCLLMLYALPLGRSIVSLDCGYKWLPGGLNYSFWQKWRIYAKMISILSPCFFNVVFFSF